MLCRYLCMLYDALCNVRYAGRAGGTECGYEVCAMQICADRQVGAMQQAKPAKWVKNGLRELKIGVVRTYYMTGFESVL